jgi:hypothetical protein
MTLTVTNCCECNTKFGSGNIVNHNNNYYCDDCYNTNFTDCHECGNTFRNEDLLSHDDEYYCNDCYSENFTDCYECGNTYPNDDLRSYNGEYYCNDCYSENFTNCYECGHTFRIEDISEYCDRLFCNDCYRDNFSDCYECGSTHYIDDLRSYDDDYYCENCYNNLTNRIIKNYSYKPIPIFYGKEKELFLGIELEVDRNDCEDDHSYYLEKLTRDEIYFKRDGSLDNGFEIVTHPVTYSYIKEHNVFDLLDALRENGYSSHNTSTCGMHIHISKKDISSLTLYKIRRLLHSNEYFFLTLAQRTKEKSDKWSSFNNDKYDDLYISKRKYCSDRYTAVNCNPDRTIEFRFMRGNLLIKRVYKNIELILSLINFCRSTSLLNINKIYYSKYIEQNKKEYKNLYDFYIEIFVSK